ncbi:MAG TPA: CBS domain-containing protein [Burkholderiales bacterium]|nr:CBS domain-containing protein [Burkholderiales bacterium]
MNASDIMTSPVITAAPHTPVREIAGLLLKHRISAVPVMVEGRLVGLVSEGDLLHRHEIGTDRADQNRSWWLRLLGSDRSIGDYVRSHARYARDIMTREVVSVSPDTPIAEIASLLETRGIKRVPVLRGDRLVGIVSRANLIQALAVAGHSGPKRPKRSQSDKAIRTRLIAELERQPWWRRGSSNAIVTEGVVHYWGMIDAEEERTAARVAAENIAGVRGVEDHRLHMYDIPSMT